MAARPHLGHKDRPESRLLFVTAAAASRALAHVHAQSKGQRSRELSVGWLAISIFEM